jgi:hypothetical protein
MEKVKKKLLKEKLLEEVWYDIQKEYYDLLMDELNEL